MASWKTVRFYLLQRALGSREALEIGSYPPKDSFQLDELNEAASRTDAGPISDYILLGFIPDHPRSVLSVLGPHANQHNDAASATIWNILPRTHGGAQVEAVPSLFRTYAQANEVLSSVETCYFPRSHEMMQLLSYDFNYADEDQGLPFTIRVGIRTWSSSADGFERALSCFAEDFECPPEICLRYAPDSISFIEERYHYYSLNPVLYSSLVDSLPWWSHTRIETQSYNNDYAREYYALTFDPMLFLRDYLARNTNLGINHRDLSYRTVTQMHPDSRLLDVRGIVLIIVGFMGSRPRRSVLVSTVLVDAASFTTSSVGVPQRVIRLQKTEIRQAGLNDHEILNEVLLRDFGIRNMIHRCEHHCRPFHEQNGNVFLSRFDIHERVSRDILEGDFYDIIGTQG